MNACKNFRFFLLLTLGLSLFLAACAGGSDKSVNDDTTKENEGAGGNLIISVLSDAASLDPHTATDVPSAAVLTNLLEGLDQER